MTECTRLSDRIPLVALGEAEWSSNELQHLASCDECRREWELVRVAQSLGAPRIPALNPEKATRTLWLRLQESRRRRTRAWALSGVALAASLAAVLWSPQTRPSSTSSGSLARGLEIPLPELEGLEPGELDSVLSTMDEPLAADSAADVPELRDLDDEELESVLDIWEG